MHVGTKLVAALGLVVAAAGCSSSPSTGDAVAASPAFASVVASAGPGMWRATGDDSFQVWVCRVPADTTAPEYGRLPLRRTFTSAEITRAVAGVGSYFTAISYGRYRPVFAAGGDVTVGRGGGPQACADAAIRAASPSARAVLVVADAEHVATAPGGIGSGGVPCPTAGPCSVHESRRFAYVGARDFAPDTIGTALDLVEHEIGHTLGWVHSGTVSGSAEQAAYDSALDVMSDSGARRRVRPGVADGPDTLAIDKVICGWLPTRLVVAAKGAHASVRLGPSDGPPVDGGGHLLTLPSLLVLPIDESTFVTVEMLAPGPADDHLTSVPGIAVHLVTVHLAQVVRVQPQFGQPPFDQLVQPGTIVRARGWNVAVAANGEVTATRQQ